MDLDPTENIAEDIIKFGVENEQAIRQRCMESALRFFQDTDVQTFIPKYRKGVLEHGGMTNGKLNTFDLPGAVQDELTDLFWYECFRMFKDFQAFNGEGR